MEEKHKIGKLSTSAEVSSMPISAEQYQTQTIEHEQHGEQEIEKILEEVEAPDEEADLFKRFFQGDKMALETLIDRNYQPIKKYFCRQLFWYPKYEQRQARAEELTQDTFNRASLKLYDYQFIEGKPFVHWLYAFANRIRLEDKRRAEKHIAESLEELLQTSQEPQDSPMNEPDTALHQKEFEQQYQQAVTDLPEMERNVWIRSTHQQLSHKAIAQQLNITEQYSRTILCRAKQHLGSILIDRGIVDPQHWQLRKGPGSDSSSSE